MLFDMHVHMFDDKIAQKALSKLEKELKETPVTNGTVSDTKLKMKSWGITAFTALNIATKPSQQTIINDWAASVQSDSVFCFGTVHPQSDDPAGEVGRIASLGLRGIKLHPDFQSFHITDKSLFPVYEEASSLGLPITFHTGRDPASVSVLRSTPAGIAQIARQFPKLIIIAAHMGGARMYDDVEQILAGKNIFFDTAITSRLCSSEQFLRIVKKHGSERILFGSDCPWQNPLEEFRWIDRLGLSSTERENIYWNNAARLFKLT